MPGFLAEHLHKPENRQFHTHLRAAMSAGIPPTVLLLSSREDATTWTMLDKKLLLAWQTYQDELCKNCGVPVWLGHTTINTVEFETETTVCYSCQHIEQDKSEPPKGGTKFAVPKPVDIEGEDVQLPSREEGLKKAQ